MRPSETGMSQWRLVTRRFFRHRLGVYSLLALAGLYLMAAFAPFVAPYGPTTRNSQFINAPPQPLRLIDAGGRVHWRPFVYRLELSRDPETLRRNYAEDHSRVHYLVLFSRGEPYRLWGLLASDVHLFGFQDGTRAFLFGTDSLGRDLLSRTVFGARISLSIGLIGVTLMVVLGAFMGILSGYFGGLIDSVLQRLNEVIMSFPGIPLWMALAASVPTSWTPAQTFFAITVILALIRWVYLARQIRGLVLALKESEYVQSAKALGASDLRIIVRHIFPNTLSIVIVVSTLSIPVMILAETALSFLGLGIQPPAVSWGTLLKDAQSVTSLVQYPWLLIPGIFVVVSILCFNFLGDALRDANDPRHAK